jgi:glycosyltransferase A (GT-A) superfamily protein (DUF2064 family)
MRLGSNTIPADVIVFAKRPRPGTSKTRLCPPCTLEEAAWLAEAALQDTLEAVRLARVRRRVLALDGSPGRWLPPGFAVVRQRGEGFDERLAAAFDDAMRGLRRSRPALLIGMDTPQITPAIIEWALVALVQPACRSVIGLARDGGWWTVGLDRPDANAFIGVPMSTSFTGPAQVARLQDLGLRPVPLMPLRDVDRWADAERVAAAAPGTRFAAAVRSLEASWSGETDGATAGAMAR